MAFAFLGPDPIQSQLTAVLELLASGRPPREIETRQVDVKEEPGRRGAGGAILPGTPRSEQAAKYLAGELACLANTAGGGALVLGVSDDGHRIGTELDAEWLRHRVFELTERKLTVDVREATLDGVRLLVLTVPEAIEPIRHNGRIFWRVGDNCVEVDPTTWHAGKLRRGGVDWSAMPSGHTIGDARPVAIEVARRFLQEASDGGDEQATSLLGATDEDLLRRLNVVADTAGTLTNAGSLLFVGTPDDAIDYIRRDVPGGDSSNRVRSSRPLVEQVYDVDQAIRTANRVVHTGAGLSKGQTRAIPLRAAREAVVNGVVHRDWISTHPTTVEHIGDTLVVTSPGGFPGGVQPENIITHPSQPRYKSLAEAMAALRLAEREGVGVDRMVRDMLVLGHRAPEISEQPGPAVRVSLVGGDPDARVSSLFADLDPASAAEDVDLALIVDHIATYGFIDASAAVPLLQRPPGEAEAALRRVGKITLDGASLLVDVDGVPSDAPPAFRLSKQARGRLQARSVHSASGARREHMILRWAQHRGRVSSTEVADLANLSMPRSGQILTELEERGELAPGRATKAGRGFFYVPAGT